MNAHIPIRTLLPGLLLFHGLSALFGGSVPVVSPDISMLGLPLYLLAHTPFQSFIIPGLILSTALGLGSCIGWCLVHRRSSWAATWVLALGIATMIWIFTQMIMLCGGGALHTIHGGVGIGLVLLARRLKGPPHEHQARAIYG